MYRCEFVSDSKSKNAMEFGTEDLKQRGSHALANHARATVVPNFDRKNKSQSNKKACVRAPFYVSRNRSLYFHASSLSRFRPGSEAGNLCVFLNLVNKCSSAACSRKLLGRLGYAGPTLLASPSARADDTSENWQGQAAFVLSCCCCCDILLGGRMGIQTPSHPRFVHGRSMGKQTSLGKAFHTKMDDI